MRSLGKGVMSATTQVKVLSPEIIHISHWARGFMNPGSRNRCMRVKGERDIRRAGV